MKNNRKKQFTLIELIIVIVVIGILAGMALPKFIGVERDSKVAALQGDLDVLDKAVLLYNSNSEDDSYPITNKIEKDTLEKTLIDTLAKIDDDSTEVYNLDESKLSPYISKLKYDINDYAYTTKSNHVIYKPGRIDSKKNIYYLNKSYLKSDGSESSKPDDGSNGEVTPPKDTTGPEVTLTPHTTNPTKKVVITLQASDENGIKSIELPDGNIVNSREMVTFEATKNGEYVFKITDNNDNVTEKKITINNIDIIKPTVTLTPNTTNETSKVVITINASDESGIKSIELPNGTKVTNKETTTYEVIANGEYTFKVTDNNDNVMEKKIIINNIVNKFLKVYGGTDLSVLESSEETSDGGYIACGYSFGGDFGTTKGQSDALIIKYDSQGNIVWSKMYGGSGVDELKSIKQTSDGGYIAVGSTIGDGDFATSKGSSDTLIIKLDRNGNKQWFKVYGGSSLDKLESVQQTNDGGYIAVGSSSGGGDFDVSKGSTDTLIIKLDSQGNKVWSKMYGGDNEDILNSVQQTSDGGYIACGSTKGGGDFTKSNGGYDTLLIKYDSQGNIVWYSRIGGLLADNLNSVKQTSDGGYIAAGSSNGAIEFDNFMSAQGVDTLLIKYDSQGNKVWSSVYGAKSSDLLFSVEQTSDGGYIACGTTYGGGDFDTSAGQKDILIIKYNKDGNKEWSKVYGGSKWDELYSIQQTSDGGFIAAGYTENGVDFNSSNSTWNTLLLKMDKNGNFK